jgi:heptosyltransferase-3
LRAEPARILVVAAPAHGDVLLATPLMAALRRTHSSATIDVLVYRGQEGILEGNPDVDQVLTGSKHPRFREYRALLRRLLRRYDLAISTKHTDRAIWYAVVAARTRIASVPPGRDRWKRWLTDARVFYDHYHTHALVQNAALAATLGIEAGTELRLPTRPAAPVEVGRLLPFEMRTQPYAVLHLNPGLPHKRWTLEGWAAVAPFLDRRGYALVLTGDGSPSENEYLDAAVRRMPVRPVNLAGKLRFADLTELLLGSTLYVGTDTVASHMAAAAGVPTVALFGPESPRVWGPWPKGGAYERTPFPGDGDQRAGNVLVVQSTAPCPTCRQGDCLRRSERGRACLLMQNLDSEQVVDGISRMLEPVEVCALPGVMSRPGVDSAASPPS